jgi:hypothetical protein
MAHDFLTVSCNVYSSGVLALKSHYLSFQCSMEKEIPTLSIPKGANIHHFFLKHLTQLEKEGWEVITIDMFKIVPWYALLKRPIK